MADRILDNVAGFAGAVKGKAAGYKKPKGDEASLINNDELEYGDQIQTGESNNFGSQPNQFSIPVLDSVFEKFQIITAPFSRLNDTISHTIRLPSYFSDRVRYVIACLLSIGFAISFGLRCNLGVAIVDVTNNSTVSEHGKSVVHVPEKWADFSTSEIGLMHGSFFWGYLLTQVPGGVLAQKFRPNKIFATALIGTSCLNLLVPSALQISSVLVMIIRFFQGLVEGGTYPSCHGIWSKWAPPLERSRLATIAFSGSYGGVVLGMILSGYLTQFIGWAAPFYFYAMVGLVWSALWCVLSSSTPAGNRYITEGEKNYIEERLAEGGVYITGPRTRKVPWKAILSSPPVWAIIVANFCRSWTFYLLVLSQAAYFYEVFGFEMSRVGLLSALPHLVMTIMVPLGGQLADFMRTKKILSTTNVRKLMNCGGFGGEAFFLLLLAFTESTSGAIAALTLAVGFSGFAISGFNVNHLDIAPQYASILMGFSNGFGTLSGIIGPLVVGWMTPDKTRNEWQRVFVVAACVHILGVIFYAIFASGEKQPWADEKASNEEQFGGDQAPFYSSKGYGTVGIPVGNENDSIGRGMMDNRYDDYQGGGAPQYYDGRSEHNGGSLMNYS
ncbi:vesicular glutamate transporter 1-like [Convolutriloba macropyga]|uniref:vesicular glutamate transporter 1-like n=1 Tax=Convolutriloba macropyga TaxID=536237 RepID=UPI003F528A4D